MSAEDVYDGAMCVSRPLRLSRGMPSVTDGSHLIGTGCSDGRRSAGRLDHRLVARAGWASWELELRSGGRSRGLCFALASPVLYDGRATLRYNRSVPTDPSRPVTLPVRVRSAVSTWAPRTRASVSGRTTVSRSSPTTRETGRLPPTLPSLRESASSVTPLRTSRP